ncbi:hypothetical protein F2Q68_00011364 [Brassica cretica]|uniref:Uncharacterized protein n=1 Tax=Brassica cretica TaxID=69181 RepID=A0A8S9KMU9_BRACR|nr:hypothetical protein F2Q68_00011364 [Brassica cretica]
MDGSIEVERALKKITATGKHFHGSRTLRKDGSKERMAFTAAVQLMLALMFLINISDVELRKGLRVVELGSCFAFDKEPLNCQCRSGCLFGIELVYKSSLGVKQAKARCKKTLADGKDLSKFQSMWSIKQQDLALKEKISKMKLLDSLIAKEGSLEDYEEALKKKLINELMNN